MKFYEKIIQAVMQYSVPIFAAFFTAGLVILSYVLLIKL